MLARLCLAAGLVATLPAAGRAAFLTGVTATTTLGNVSGNEVARLTDGSGLSSLSLSATHAAATFGAAGTGNCWIGIGVVGQVNFDLHGAYSLAGMSVWNFNGNNKAGVNAVQVLTSLDGVAYAPLAGGPSNFAIGANTAPEGPQQFTFGPAAAAFVRFNILSNYGFQGAVGMSEVAFDGAPVVSAVSTPAPAGLAVLTGAAGLLAAFRRVRPSAA